MQEYRDAKIMEKHVSMKTDSVSKRDTARAIARERGDVMRER